MKPRQAKARKSGRMKVLITEDKERRMWSAQCLEHDIAAQAKTLPDLYYELQRVVAAQLTMSNRLKVKPFKHLPRAPQVYWEIFKKSQFGLEGPRPSRQNQPISDLRLAELQAV